MSQSYLRNSQGCLAVYDITDRVSFETLEDELMNYIALLGEDNQPKPQSKDFKQFKPEVDN
tara:strand:- start:318 stop:500 length:183 start_codon:yes stop_codon:yes gene_type:complete